MRSSHNARRVAVLLGVVAATGAARPVHALEPVRIGDTPVSIDVTEVASVTYNGNNRDTRPNQVSTRANDDFGLFYSRTNLQANAGEFVLSLRVDSAWFYASPNPTQIALDLTTERPSAAGGAPRAVYFRGKLYEAGRELSNRYIDWTYPSKYALSYAGHDIEASVGDSYVQFGRGLVLSLRKQDEIASDTTLRGVRLSGRTRAGELRVRATGLFGSLNPLRIDPSSGRYLGVDASVTPGLVALTEAGMPRTIATDFAPNTGSCTTSATCSYAPDRLYAGQLELSGKSVTFALQASRLERGPPLSFDIVRAARSISTGSASLELTPFGSHGAFYTELALQNLSQSDASAPALGNGYALYASLNLASGPLSVLLEGKRYRKFFPLLANVSLVRAREFSTLAYSAPPTTEALYVDTEFERFNTCVSGGRLKGDLALAKGVETYAWLGHYQSFAESVSNEVCEESSATRNRVWDMTSGFVLHSSDRRSKADVSLGTRFDDTDRALDVGSRATHVFYRELYTRHQLGLALGGPYALDIQGWHRRRHQTLGGPGAPWSEGQELVGLEWSPHFWFSFGFEYDTNPQVPPSYFNGQFGYRVSSDSSVSLFVGQRRGALRCVGGICRVFPPFEGASLDVTLRL